MKNIWESLISCLFSIFCVLIIWITSALCVMILWNTTLPYIIDGCHPMTYMQALKFYILMIIIFKFNININKNNQNKL